MYSMSVTVKFSFTFYLDFFFWLCDDFAGEFSLDISRIDTWLERNRIDIRNETNRFGSKIGMYRWLIFTETLPQPEADTATEEKSSVHLCLSRHIYCIHAKKGTSQRAACGPENLSAFLKPTPRRLEIFL